MTFRAAAVAVGAVWMVGAAAQMGVGAQQKTVWDGVYTEDQAKRGAAGAGTGIGSPGPAIIPIVSAH